MSHRNIMKLFLLVCALAGIINCTAAVNVRYVTTSGNNAASGMSTGTAWRDIQFGAQQLNPGDELRVGDGVYAEYLQNWNGGSSGNFIVFTNYQGGTVTVRAPAGSEFVAHMSSAGESWLRFYGFDFDAINIDGGAFKVTSGSQHVDFYSCTFRNSGSSHGLQTSTGDIQADTYVRCYDCNFHDNGIRTYDGGTENHGYYNSSTRFNEFYRCNFWGNHSHGIHNYNGTPDHNIYADSRAFLNPIGVGIYSGTNNLVYNFLCYSNMNIGFRADYDCDRTRFYFCTAWKNDINFQIASVGVGTDMANNISAGAITRGIEIYDRGQIVTNRYNLSEGNGSDSAGANYFNENGSDTIESNNQFGSQYDAAFVNAAGTNFALQASSSARNAGLTLATVTADAIGVARPQEGAPDPGAFEYSAGGTLPTVTVNATDSLATEQGPTTGVFTFTRTGGGTVGALTINFTVGGTAASGVDYTSIGTTAIIPDGFSSVTKVVTPIDDPAFEVDETVNVAVSASGTYTVGTPGGAELQIRSDDPAPPVGGTIPGPGNDIPPYAKAYQNELKTLVAEVRGEISTSVPDIVRSLNYKLDQIYAAQTNTNAELKAMREALRIQ